MPALLQERKDNLGMQAWTLEAGRLTRTGLTLSLRLLVVSLR